MIAPADGTVLPPPERPTSPESPGQLKSWSGTPFDRDNIGATLSDSTLFCEIGDPHQDGSQPVIEQDDMEFVHEDQPIKVKLDEFPHRTFRSQITEIAKVDLKVTPRICRASRGGEVITKTDEAGTERPQNTSYEARAPIDDPDGLLTVGLKGRAKIYTAWQSLGARCWRYLRGRSTSSCSSGRGLLPAGRGSVIIAASLAPAGRAGVRPPYRFSKPPAHLCNSDLSPTCGAPSGTCPR